MHDALTLPLFARMANATTPALRTRWPAVVAQALQPDVVHEHERQEITFTRN